MTRLFNDPDDFLDELVEGFVAASGRWVRAVPGGVVRSTRSPEPTVAVVIGGGSGHYPAFAGLVGPGLAHGAAMGNLFASPSTQRAYSVAKAADQGRGVLFSYGNYAGDVLNFDAAQDQLRGEGIDCRTVLVTDDIWSAKPDEVEKRRGIAGDLTVFKIACAAAEEGSSLDEVERVARLANDRTRSFGVAFAGCTLPGAAEPLFTVPEGRMAVGLGIHGEPGIDETDVPTADELAELFVSRLLDEVPAGVDAGGRPRRADPQRPGLGQVRGALRRLPRRRPAAARGRRRGRRSGGRRVLHELRHGGVLAHPALAGRRTGTAVDRPRGHACVPPRLGRAAGARGRRHGRGRAADDPARERGVPGGGDRDRRPARAGGRGDRRAGRRARPAGLGRRRRRPRDRHAARQPGGCGGGPVGGRGGGGCRHDAGRSRRRVVRPGRRHLRRDLGTHPAHPRPGVRRRRTGGESGGVGECRRGAERRDGLRQGPGRRQDHDRRDRAVRRRPQPGDRGGAAPARRLAARRGRRRAGRPRHRAAGGEAGAGPVARRQEHRHPRPGCGVLRPGVHDGGGRAGEAASEGSG